MSKKVLIMVKGLPGSGKSTWSKSEVEKDGDLKLVSIDKIREDRGGFSQKGEKEVFKKRNELVREYLNHGKSVIVDATNLNPVHERSLRSIANECGADFEIKSFLDVDIEECVKRDLGREHSVGERVIYNMYYKWIHNEPPVNEKYEKEWKLPRVILFDIDGTLAHNEGGRNVYDEKRVYEDTPDPMLTYIASMCRVSFNEISKFNKTHKYLIGIVSGRHDNCKSETERWLKEKAMIDFDFLFMRRTGDNRPDDVVKSEIYEKKIKGKYCVMGVFDDRPKVCRMWREKGLKVCQVGDPYNEF